MTEILFIPKKSKRGMASASKQVRERVSKAGGLSKHETRGLENVDKNRRIEISRLGAKKRWQKK
jgi:hypothetical protein